MAFIKAQDMAPVAWAAIVASALKYHRQLRCQPKHDTIPYLESGFSIWGLRAIVTGKEMATYEVWSSLLPDHMITWAGDVLVASVLLRASSPVVAFLKKPNRLFVTPLRSPRP